MPKGASDFSEQMERLAPRLAAVCSWLGQNWHKLLAIAGDLLTDQPETRAMAKGRNVQIGRDAQGSIINTGDHFVSTYSQANSQTLCLRRSAPGR